MPALEPLVRRDAERYLRQADRARPGLVVGFYVVGSAALGAYHRRHSDIDFVAVLAGSPSPEDVRALRSLHRHSGLVTAATAVAERRSPLTGTLNGVFVRQGDLTMPVTRITPVASQVGVRFRVGKAGSDLSPVGWKVFAERGIAIRGDEPGTLSLDPQPDQLGAWTLGNLESYWTPWADSVAAHPRAYFTLRPRWATAWGVLGAPRLHCTIASGQIISKEAAGHYARETFDPRWEPLISDALAYRAGGSDRLRLPPDQRGVMTAEFVHEVINASRQLAAR